jgi:hypothetical protein
MPWQRWQGEVGREGETGAGAPAGEGKDRKEEMESVLEEWNGLVGEQSERPADKHAACKIPHDGFGLDVQVTEHFVAAPATEETDDVGVNLCTQ